MKKVVGFLVDKFYFITFAQNLRTYKISDYVLDTRISF